MPIHLLGHGFEYDSPHVLETTLLRESLDFQSLRRGQFVPQRLLETSIISRIHGYSAFLWIDLS